jgi:hypothetical protein
MLPNEFCLLINNQINSYSYYKTLKENWEFDDCYLLALNIYSELNNLGIYDY